VADWHPILNAVESRVGTWVMIGPLDEPYAVVETVRRGQELGYRVTTRADGAEAVVIGYFRTFRAACKAAHSWFTSTRGPSGRPHAGWLPSPTPPGAE
jgi:nicotinamidase-related amidase